MPLATSQLPASVVRAMKRGNKIEAIRLLRELTGLGLKDAKDAVEASRPGANPKPSKQTPDKVARSGSLIWWFVAVAVAVIADYFIRSSG